MRVAVRLGLLVVLWLLAWGDVSLANVLSGTLVAAAILLAFPSRRGRRDLRLDVLGALRLAGYVVSQLLLSNLVMATEILRRTPRTEPAVLAHRLHQPSEVVVTIMTSIIALSPGTMTVDVAADSSTLYVHFFRLTDVDAGRAELARLEQLTVGAIRTPTATRPPPGASA